MLQLPKTVPCTRRALFDRARAIFDSAAKKAVHFPTKLMAGEECDDDAPPER